MFLRPEQSPRFPYEHYPYTHIHPNSMSPGRQHVLYRGHDCWCEPILSHVLDAHKKLVAVVVIHNIWTNPDGPGEKKAPYPKLRNDPNEL